MPDWHKLVSERLADLALDVLDKEEVVAELAGHLEETYEPLRRDGRTDEDAVQRALSQVRDWHDLKRKVQNIRQKENIMSTRVSCFWLPSFLTLTISMSLFPLLSWVGLPPRFFFLHGPQSETYMSPDYVAWLLALPLIGVLGAHLSKRAGGTRRAMILSGLFPALAFSFVLLLVVPFSMFLENGFRATTAPLGLSGLIALWVLLPGACLLAGVLAYESLMHRRLKPAS